MRQLILGLDPDTPPSLDNFVIGQNTELMQLLALYEQFQTNASGERSVYIWGETGVGKTHLLHALSQHTHARYIKPENEENQFLFSPEIKLYLLDDCEQLSPSNQINAFALFNEVRANNGFFVASGKQAPMQLNLREDLRTRLGWSLIYQVHGLTDEDKISALDLAAQAKGIKLGTGVLSYLITHYQRDMNSLTAMVEKLDHYSLEKKRPITLPLLQELLQLPV